MKRWTQNDIPDLTGKVALVTGANSGLGYWTALHLGRRGAHVVMACRSPERAQAALGAVRAAAPGGSFELLALDLADLASVRRSADEFRSRHARLDILCLNAGISLAPLARTKDGFESQFGANFVGHFAYTGHLLDLVRNTPDSRVVHVASIAAKGGRLNFDDPNFERRRFTPPTGYAQSKLANLVFALELDRRFRRAGLDAISVAAHPGYAATNITSSNPLARSRVGKRLVKIGDALLGQPAERGALPQLYAATMPGVEGGQYFGPTGPMEMKGPPGPARIVPKAQSAEAGAKLWELAERLTNVRYLDA